MILTHIKRLVDLCYPASIEDALELRNSIKPVKRAQITTWTVAGEYILWAFGIPDDSAYFAVLRVDGYVTTNVPTAPGYGLFGPLPPVASATTGTAFWSQDIFIPSDPQLNISGQEEISSLVDVHEFFLVKAGINLNLHAILPANPDANARFIRTIVYGYLLGPQIADRIGVNEVMTLGGFTT